MLWPVPHPRTTTVARLVLVALLAAPLVAASPRTPARYAQPSVEGWVLFQVEEVKRCARFGRGVYLLTDRFRIHNYRDAGHGRGRAEAVSFEDGAMYDLTRAYRAKHLQHTTSDQSPSSTHPGHYLLVVSTSNTFCATRYSSRPAGKHAVRVDYTDCDTGAECQVPLTTSRPFPIEEFETDRVNVLPELWRAQQADPARRQEP